MSTKTKPVVTLKVPNITVTDTPNKRTPRAPRAPRVKAQYDIKPQNVYYVQYTLRDTLDMLQLNASDPDKQLLDQMDATLVSHTDSSLCVNRSRAVYYMSPESAQDVFNDFVSRYGDRLLHLKVVTDKDDAPPKKYFW